MACSYGVQRNIVMRVDQQNLLVPVIRNGFDCTKENYLQLALPLNKGPIIKAAPCYYDPKVPSNNIPI